MNSEIPTKGPIFICGMNGSGTTMLLDCLNEHPDLYGFPIETRSLPYFIRNLPKYGDINIDENFLRLLNDVRNLDCFRICNDGMPPPIPDEWQDLRRDLATIVDGIFKYFASRDGKSRWCEKTPMHALHITTLASVFSDARFVHVIRDGRDCAASFHRRWGYKPERTIYRWKNVVREARRQGSSLGEKYLEVYYEEITRTPEQEMRRVCEFLDVSFTEAVLRPSRYRKRNIGWETEGIAPNSGKWHNYFDDQQVQQLEKIAGEMLAELNYPNDQPYSNFDPSALLVKMWTCGDDVRFLFSKLIKISGQNSAGFKIPLSSKVITAIRQRLTTKW